MFCVKSDDVYDGTKNVSINCLCLYIRLAGAHVRETVCPRPREDDSKERTRDCACLFFGRVSHHRGPASGTRGFPCESGSLAARPGLLISGEKLSSGSDGAEAGAAVSTQGDLTCQLNGATCSSWSEAAGLSAGKWDFSLNGLENVENLWAHLGLRFS